MRLMIGYGNPLRRDDRLGQYLAEKLGQSWRVIASTQLMPEYAEAISHAERVVFIDASIGAKPGEILCKVVDPIPAAGAFTHHATPASLLAAAGELYGASPPALLISITGQNFELGFDFSPAICALLPEITNCVGEFITAFTAKEQIL